MAVAMRAVNSLPHPILPTQFIPAEPTSPMKRLCYAILEQALHDLRLQQRGLGWFRHDTTSDRRRAAEEAELIAWFLADDHECPCSFIRLCEVLELCPNAVRERLTELGPRRRRSYVRQTRPLGVVG